MYLLFILFFVNLKSFEMFITPRFIKNMMIEKCNTITNTPNKQIIEFQNSNETSVLSKMNLTKTNEIIKAEDLYNLNWYVIGETSSFRNNKLYKIQIWDNDYVVWKNKNKYYAMDDACSHRGATLSDGKIKNNNIVCPYHGYEFNSDGVLVKVPGLNFTNTNCQNQRVYNIVEQDGWIYMNTISKNLYEPSEINIYQEPEVNLPGFSKVHLNFDFNAFGRIVSENSLDVMHIGFVHTFGNQKNPSPIKEVPPYLVGDYPYHYKTEYDYLSGKDSIAKQIFMIDKLKIENEFILPHTTVARIYFGNATSTVITSTLPHNSTHSKLYVKTYRNFWNINDTSMMGKYYNLMGDLITEITMTKTVLEDKHIVENIKHIEGKFNMKYDKLQNVYKTLYKKMIYNVTKL